MVHRPKQGRFCQTVRARNAGQDVQFAARLRRRDSPNGSPRVRQTARSDPIVTWSVACQKTAGVHSARNTCRCPSMIGEEPMRRTGCRQSDWQSTEGDGSHFAGSAGPGTLTGKPPRHSTTTGWTALADSQGDSASRRAAHPRIHPTNVAMLDDTARHQLDEIPARSGFHGPSSTRRRARIGLIIGGARVRFPPAPRAGPAAGWCLVSRGSCEPSVALAVRPVQGHVADLPEATFTPRRPCWSSVVTGERR